MPLDEDHAPDERDDLSDDESLFGSPPPSPGARKTLSPALPSRGLDSEQNVGTLALPGSHNPSKLPVDSVVYLLDARHRPVETQSCHASTPAEKEAGPSTSSAPTATGPDPAPQSSRSPTNGASKKRKRPKKSSSTTSAAIPGPSIELPSSDEPIPPNFLRNQQALLGIAGLVANINPASLSTRRRNQGNDPSSPIVVEDEGTALPRFGQPAAPTPSQLLATLSAQRDLFPVLEQLLGILRRGVDPPVQSPPIPSQQPPKRRKLSQVPAGATDWDVPFPFPPGEGPSNYQEEWTTERCEHLISEFITLLREGTNKATARASAKRAASQPAPKPPAQSHPTSPRRSLPPTNGSCHSPPSNYVPLPLDAYLRPTLPHVYTAPPPAPSTTQSPESGVDLLTSMFGAVMSPQDGQVTNSDSFGLSLDSLPLGLDLDPQLLSLMGIGPSQGGPNVTGSPAPSLEEASTPALLHSPYRSHSIASVPGPATPTFDPSFAMFSPSPPGSTASQQDQVGIFGSAPPLGHQGGAYFGRGESLYEDLTRRGMFTERELGMDLDDDLSRAFEMDVEVQCEQGAAGQPPHFCDPPSVEPPTPPRPVPSTQIPGMAGPPVSSVNAHAHASNVPLPPSMLSQGTTDTSTFSTPQQDPLPPLSSNELPTFATTSLQRQLPVPKRPIPATPPSRSKAAATLAVAKKRREDAIQQAKDLKRQLLTDVGKSKVQLWELTMEQGVLTRMSKDGRLKGP